MTDANAPSASPAIPPATPPATRTGSRRRWILFVVVLLVVAGFGYYFVSHLGTESTDDAFLEGNVHRVSFKVAGRISHVHVHDNQLVAAGMLLAELDPAEFQARVDAARAALDLAKARQREAEIQVTLADAGTNAALARSRANLTAAQAHVEQQDADLGAARAEATRTAADLARYEQLSERAVSKARLDLAHQTATMAGASEQVAQKRIASAKADVSAAEADVAAAEADRKKVDGAHAAVERSVAEVAQAAAELHEAELQLIDTKVFAPAAGHVTKKAVLDGGYVDVGQSLLAIVEPEVWITANFKETQLSEMQAGQSVRIYIDAYGIELRGHVDSVQAGTGSRFSLLPPENATGNYVKVVQRVPVKIVLDEQPDADRYLLAPGMSVVPVVVTR